MDKELLEYIDWHERAGRGEVEPSLTFTEGTIKLHNRFGWPTTDSVVYDDLLLELHRHGRALYKQCFMLGSPKQDRAIRKLLGFKLPVVVISDAMIADWRHDRRGGWRTIDPAGRELLISKGGLGSIWRDCEPIRYAGYANVWLEDDIALAVANELALGNRVNPFHFEGEEYGPNATALRISASLYAEDQRSIDSAARSRGGVRRGGCNG